MTTPVPPDQIPGVQPEDLPADLPEGSALLDVREDDEWRAGHAAEAVHLPMSELPQRLDEIPEADRLYVVCRSGGRSARVTAYLNANGWDAVNVERGMNGWAATGRPLVSDGPGEPCVL
ncbi:rhodanese-like domain-containing protein [Saccharopolyspora sp. CA-218241]|uniref:rhodanese-like domain-containing protein n=1 Tax=Saccharopolyspora sp. CA-218241 TaxID=3240027 RepID=UPI003D99D5D5